MRLKKLFPLFVTALFLIATAQDCKKNNSGTDITPETPATEEGGENEDNEEAEKIDGQLSRTEKLDSIRQERIGKKIKGKPELRGVWVSTVEELDWPMGCYDEEGQKALYRTYLDLFEKLNINAVFFQVRPLADAFYDSPYEPWSAMITSEAGKNPGYDVLKFLIDETHSRGMQFHAWMNPYRIAKRKGADDSFPPLDSKIPAELTLDYNGCRIYNPALPEVRTRIADIIKDLMSHYDVDGIHFDDYFYPSLSKDEPMRDEKEYALYGQEFGSIEEFRRHNVEMMVTEAREAVKSSNPEAIFSISPAGNYEYCMNSMYFDIHDICSKGLIDLIIPQLYWSTTAPTDYYTPRIEWFSLNTAEVPMLIGYGIYRFGSGSKGFESASEFLTEYRLAKKYNKVHGGIMFRAYDLITNKVGITDTIAYAYAKPSPLPDFSKHKD